MTQVAKEPFLTKWNSAKCQNKWKITPNFCGVLRKAELYENCMSRLVDENVNN